MSDLSLPISNLLAAVTERRASNIRYRQNALLRLHSALRVNSALICTAITKDLSCGSAVAAAEFTTTITAVGQFYEELDFEAELKDEYRVARGEDNLGRKTSVGTVAIRAGRHSRFYSVLLPLAAAVAAGNVVVLEMSSASSEVDTVLSSLLPNALDQDLFVLVSSPIPHSILAKVDLFVDQTGNTPQEVDKLSLSILLSSCNSLTLAVVDRSANVIAAAQALVDSRMSPYRTSPYAPDVILVSAWVSETLAKECLMYATTSYSPGAGSQGDKVISRMESEMRERVEKAEALGKVRVFRSPRTELQVVEVLDESLPILHTKVKGPFIILLPTTSTVHTISHSLSLSLFNPPGSSSSSLSTQTGKSPPPFLATYLFASLALCKFLSEQIPSSLSCINHIPNALLFGPAAPFSSFPSSAIVHPRYTASMFSVSRPQLVTPNIAVTGFASSDLRSTGGRVTTVSGTGEFITNGPMVKELKGTGQKPGFAIGFFEQGILIGLGIAASVMLTGVGWGIWRFGGRVKGLVW